MNFTDNLREVKAERREVDEFPPETTKRRINELLFEIMPASATLREVEDLAVAVFMAVQSAWNARTHPAPFDPEAVQYGMMPTPNVCPGAATRVCRE